MLYEVITDMFLCNDPWVGGGLHQNDVSLFAPLFHDGKLFAWTGAVPKKRTGFCRWMTMEFEINVGSARRFVSMYLL